MEEINRDELINYGFVLEIIRNQLNMVASTDPEYYSKYIFEVVNEQQFVPDEDREPGRIFIIIKFLPADIDYGQDVLPFTIQAVSESNGLPAAQKLLLEYAQIFNLKSFKKEGKVIYQSYTTPNVISHFEIIYDGFRSVLVMSGTILISSNVNRSKLIFYVGDTAEEVLEIPNYKVADLVTYEDDVYQWNGTQYVKYDGEEVDALAFNDIYNATPDTQPYFENDNMTESIVKYGSYSFTCSFILTKNNLNDKILQVVTRRKNPDTNFYFKILQDDGNDMPFLKYKMIHFGRTQNKGEMPSAALAFTI